MFFKQKQEVCNGKNFIFDYLALTDDARKHNKINPFPHP